MMLSHCVARFAMAGETAETMEIVNFHLGRLQKQALKERTKAYGTSLAEEIRNAIDAYLGGATPDGLELLEAAALQAEAALVEMSAAVEATNRKAAAVFAELERLQGGGSARSGDTRSHGAHGTSPRASH
jgi:hypothetical protein